MPVCLKEAYLVLYKRDMPTSENHTTATSADDTAILEICSIVKKSTENLQRALNSITDWTKNEEYR